MNGRKWLLFLLFHWVLQDDSLNLKCVKSNMKNSYCHCILKYILLKICIKLSFWCHQGISSNYSIEFIPLVLFGHDQMTFIVKYLLFYNFFFGVANIANLFIINFVNNNVVNASKPIEKKNKHKKLKIFLKCSAAFMCFHANLNRKWCWCAMHFWALSMQLIFILLINQCSVVAKSGTNSFEILKSH